jgi:hypothetical protein
LLQLHRLYDLWSPFLLLLPGCPDLLSLLLLLLPLLALVLFLLLLLLLLAVAAGLLVVQKHCW